MCYTLDVFYSCKGGCLGRNGKKFSVVFDRQRVDLKRFQVCPKARAGWVCTKSSPREHYEFRYPMRCWTCQAHWTDKMKPSVSEIGKVKKRIESLYSRIEAEGQVNERVRQVVDRVRQITRQCNDDAETSERKLDAELQTILGTIHQGQYRVADGQERLDRVTDSVD